MIGGKTWRLAGGLLALAIGSAYIYTSTILSPAVKQSMLLHRQILSDAAPSPYAYRLLAPWGLEGLLKVVTALGVPADKGFLVAEGLWATLGIWCSLAVLSWALGRRYGNLGIACATAVGVFSMNMALRDHYYQPWSLIEPAIFALAYEWIQRDRFKSLIALVVIGTFNRETTCFVVLLYALYWWYSGSKYIFKVGVLSVTWLFVFSAIRLIIGPRPFVHDFSAVVNYNVSVGALVHTSVAWMMFLGPFWYCLFRGVGTLDRRSKQAMLSLVAFGSIFVFEGCWWETRPWMSFYCIVLPPMCIMLNQFVLQSATTYESGTLSVFCSGDGTSSGAQTTQSRAHQSSVFHTPADARSAAVDHQISTTAAERTT